MMSVYVMLNRYRTGEAFFSITGLENWLRPVFDIARYGYAQPYGRRLDIPYRARDHDRL